MAMSPVTIVIIVVVLFIVLFAVVAGVGICLRLWRARRVRSVGPGPPAGRQRGRRTSSTQMEVDPPPLYQPGPPLPPTYDTVIVNSTEYPTVWHGERAPCGTTPPLQSEMTAGQMA